MFTNKTNFNGAREYHAYTGQNDLYRITKVEGGYDVWLHEYEPLLSAMADRTCTKTTGTLVNEFHLLRDAKAYVKEIVRDSYTAW